jgi:predicted small secreted protein
MEFHIGLAVLPDLGAFLLGILLRNTLSGNGRDIHQGQKEVEIFTGWQVICKTTEKLYRAVTKSGDTIDFYLSSTRNAKAAKRFLAKALRPLYDW